MNKKLTFVAMLAMALTLGACNSHPASSSSDSGTDNPTSSNAPTTSSSTTTPTPTTSVTPSTPSVTPDTSTATPTTPTPSTSTPTPTTPTPSTPTPTPSTSTPAPVEEYKVYLPEISGLSIRASKLEPEEGEEVTLYLSTSASRRLDAVSVNGTSLEIMESNQKGTKICKFKMPAKQDAVVETTVVDVYAIRVDDAVKDYFGIVCDVTSAAENETVTFKPASYAGYWFRAVTTLEDDVVLQPNEDGSYSFKMPRHAVTLSAITGESVYAVTWDSEGINRMSAYYYTPHPTDPERTMTNYLSQGDAVPVGTVVYLKISDTGYVKQVDKVGIHGNELTMNENGEYVITMPTYPIHFDVTLKDHIRYVSCDSSDHYNVKLTKKVTDDNGNESYVETSTALYGDTIYIEVSDKTPDVFHPYVVSSYNLFYGDTAEDVSKTSTSYKVSSDNGKYYFTVGNYEYSKVTLNEVESVFKGTKVPGTYQGYKGNYSTNVKVELYEDGTARMDGINYKAATKYKENVYSLTQNTSYTPKTSYVYVDTVEEEKDGAKQYKSTRLLVDVDGEALSSKNETFVVANNLGAYNADASFAYGVFTKVGYYTKVVRQYYHVSFADGVIDVYYDDEKKEIYWDVTTEYLSGDGSAVGDIVAIKKDDKVLATFKIKALSRKNDGYQHEVEEVSADSVVGSYTNGDSTLVLNGFGKATLDGASGSYVIDSENANKILVTIGEDEKAFILDLENHTFASATLPTDGYEGTYSGANGDLVLDGYGNATLNGVTGTYVLDNNLITVTVNETTYSYELNKDGSSYTALSTFAGLKFKGSYTNKLDEDYNVDLTFNMSSQPSGTLVLGYAFKFQFDGSYDDSTKTLTMTITSAPASDLVSKVITATVNYSESGAIVSITFNEDINYNVYNIKGVTATLVA